jgi:hypothetical protein
VEDASQWMRLIGGLALLAPFALSRMPMFRAHARRIGLAATILYIAFGIGFVLWYTLIRT